jgi:hypothetical protein
LDPGLKDGVSWDTFYELIVEDRADAPPWNKIDDQQRAAWLAHQFFCKLASPGRIYRFQRQAEEFFQSLLDGFRERAAADENRWRVQRFVLTPEHVDSSWENRQTYSGRYEDAPLGLLYREKTKDFLSICNMARVLKAGKDEQSLCGITLKLKADDGKERDLKIKKVTEEVSSLGVYHPIIPLELSPVRFRVLLPLEAASDCVDQAIEAWRDQFSRVWDRLPLRVGVVAFPRKTPFQAVIEATRSLEDTLTRSKKPETLRVAEYGSREGAVVLKLKSCDDKSKELLQIIPTQLPDGRNDVFYPYLAVEDTETRFPLDFQHPRQQVYRHAQDLCTGDGVQVYPSCISTIFLENTSCRFDPFKKQYLNEWQEMRDIWKLIACAVPSQTALRGAWSQLLEHRGEWKGPDGNWLEGGEQGWLDFARAVFHNRLGLRDACLETLVEAAGNGILEWSLDWHLSVLKKQVSGGSNDRK